MEVQGLLPVDKERMLEGRLRPISRELKSLEFLTRLVEINKLNDGRAFSARGVSGETASVESAAMALRGMVTITVPRNDNLVLVTVEHPNPQLATELANSLAEQFIRFKGCGSGDRPQPGAGQAARSHELAAQGMGGHG